MVPIAHICHAIAGRLRIRVPAKRRDTSYLLNAQQKLASLHGVDSVEANPITGTLLLHHHLNPQAIVEFARGQDLFTITTPDNTAARDSETVSERAYGALRALDQYVRGLSGGGTDFWGVIFLVMLGLGIKELIKGNISSPATTMLWYAVGALMLAQGKQEMA
jgi:hypothetical protein